MALKNVFGYLGLSALCGYEGLNEDKRLLPDGATLLEQSRFTYGGAIHSSVELFLTDNLLFVLKAQGRLPFGSDLHRFRPAISAGLKSYFPLQNAIWSGARPAPDAPSSPRRAGGAGSELPRRKKGRCAHRPFKVNAVYLLWKQKLSYIQVCI